MSATVIVKNVMDTDVLSTAIFVLGSEKDIALLDSLNDAEGLTVDIKKEVSVSRNMGSIEIFSLKSWNYNFIFTFSLCFTRQWYIIVTS